MLYLSWTLFSHDLLEDGRTELKLSAAGKLRQLREFSREHPPALAVVAVVNASVTMAKVVAIRALIRPPSVDDVPDAPASSIVRPTSTLICRVPKRAQPKDGPEAAMVEDADNVAGTSLLGKVVLAGQGEDRCLYRTRPGRRGGF
jgi:hypothetical protein